MHVDRLGRNVGKLLWRQNCNLSIFRGSWTDDDDNEDGDCDANDDDGDAADDDDDVATIHPSFRVSIWVHPRQITSTPNADINMGVLLAGSFIMGTGWDRSTHGNPGQYTWTGPGAVFK